jgi:hypothetical protein
MAAHAQQCVHVAWVCLQSHGLKVRLATNPAIDLARLLPNRGVGWDTAFHNQPQTPVGHRLCQNNRGPNQSNPQLQLLSHLPRCLTMGVRRRQRQTGDQAGSNLAR